MVQLGIAILLPDEAHNALRRVQLDVVRACGQNPALRHIPHVTLKQPFHAKALEPVEAYFDELVAEMRPFEITLSGLGTFDEERVIYLDVTADPCLESIRRAVLRDLQERFRVKPRDIEDDQYRFHATVAYNLTAEEFDKARAALADAELKLSFIAQTVGLFYYTGDVWIAYKRSQLTSELPSDSPS
jgi:2'-5' RNA ligase